MPPQNTLLCRDRCLCRRFGTNSSPGGPVRGLHSAERFLGSEALLTAPLRWSRCTAATHRPSRGAGAAEAALHRRRTGNLRHAASSETGRPGLCGALHSDAALTLAKNAEIRPTTWARRPPRRPPSRSRNLRARPHSRRAAAAEPAPPQPP